MTRIVAGVAGGRRLSVPAGRSTRPTADRAREGLFATILALRGPLGGARVLDLYAGSGAVGLEALSRGAADVLLVESDARAARVIRRNIDTVGLPGARVLTDKVERVLARGPGGDPPRDVVFADPPYSTPDTEVQRMLAALRDGVCHHGLLHHGDLDHGDLDHGDLDHADLDYGDLDYGGGHDQGCDHGGWLAPGALVVVERGTRSGPFAWPAGYTPERSRGYGEATLWYGLAAGARPATASSTGG
jgi:16S rRNA (guanine966-N2)-methyltransferase